MSGRIVKEVLDNAPADLTKQELLVLVSLAESAFDRDRIAIRDASADAIADRTRSTPSAVRNTLVDLKERGLIVPMIDRPTRGHAQHWYIPRLSKEHRSAMVKASLPGDAKNRSTRTGKRHPSSDANSTGKRHLAVTPEPVENTESGTEIASPEPLGKRHRGVAPPVEPSPVTPVPATQLPAEVPPDDAANETAADRARRAIREARR